MEVWINRKKYDKYGKNVGEVTKYKIVWEVEIKENVVLITYLTRTGKSMIYEKINHINSMKIIGD